MSLPIYTGILKFFAGVPFNGNIRLYNVIITGQAGYLIKREEVLTTAVGYAGGYEKIVDNLHGLLHYLLRFHIQCAVVFCAKFYFETVCCNVSIHDTCFLHFELGGFYVACHSSINDK